MSNAHSLTPNGRSWTCVRCHHVAADESEYTGVRCAEDADGVRQNGARMRQWNEAGGHAC